MYLKNDLKVSYSYVAEGVSLFGGVACMSFWENIDFPLRAYFLYLFLACPEATENIL